MIKLLTQIIQSNAHDQQIFTTHYKELLSVCLASSVGEVVSRFDACSLMPSGGPPGSIPGADSLDSGFHSLERDKMSNIKYVVG